MRTVAGTLFSVALLAVMPACEAGDARGRQWLEAPEDVRVTRTMGFLFPETRGWTVYADLRPAAPGDLKDWHPLRDAPVEPKAKAGADGRYNALKFGGEECGEPYRQLSAPDAWRDYRKAGIWVGAPPTLIYSGGAECSEALVTIVWRIAAGGSVRSVQGEGGELVSIRTGLGADEPAALTSYDWDRSGGGDETYTLSLPGEGRSVTIRANKGLEVPVGATEVERYIVLGEEAALQTGPGPLDVASYREGVEDFRNLDMVPAGTGVGQRLSYLDGAGQSWALVIAKGGTTPAPSFVAGWVKVPPTASGTGDTGSRP